MWILDLLNVASKYTRPKSCLYLPVHMFTDYRQTLKAAISRYQTKLIAIEQLMTKDLVEKTIDFYSQLNETGLIRIFKVRERNGIPTVTSMSCPLEIK